MTFSSPGVNRDMMTSSFLACANVQIVLHCDTGAKGHVQNFLHIGFARRSAHRTGFLIRVIRVISGSV